LTLAENSEALYWSARPRSTLGNYAFFRPAQFSRHHGEKVLSYGRMIWDL